MNYLKLVLLMILLSGHLVATAQSLSVGSTPLEDYYRRGQLLGDIDSSLSFSIRPLYTSSTTISKDIFYPDTTDAGFNLLKIKNSSWASEKGKLKARLLPFNLQLQFNSDNPYGWNDGAMIPASDLQTLVSGGIYAEYGNFSFQFKPEIVLASNPVFDGFSKDHYDIIAARYYDFYNFIDLPERFGGEGYSRIYWGQSSIRFNFDPLSFGLSTENLWWGPGIRNSLLMSNTAPGFKHLTLNTARPIKTPIGSFEEQLIIGRLEGSGFTPLTPNRTYLSDVLYVPKEKDWRYIAGFALCWQPKWIPGLFLGTTRSFQTYSKDLGKGFGDYLPISIHIQKVSSDNPINKRNQLSSSYIRWIWQKEKAEVYFEYGFSDPSASLRDLLLEPENSRAYIFGLRKLFPLKGRMHENIYLGLEVTQLQQTSITKVRNAESWYLNKHVRDGYTNRGQLLGAGIGPGANMQSLDVSWTKGLRRVGIQVERYVHNNDFYYYAFEDSQDWRRHWYDLSLGINWEWNYKNFIFNGIFNAIKSYNYQYNYPKQQPGDPYIVPGIDQNNGHIKLGATYRF